MEETTFNQSSCPEKGDSCVGIGVQYAEVSLPVKLSPEAIVGSIKTECCGEPRIFVSQNCHGKNGSGCRLIITQSLCIKIPLEYKTTAEAGESTINCRNSCHPGCR